MMRRNKRTREQENKTSEPTNKRMSEQGNQMLEQASKRRNEQENKAGTPRHAVGSQFRGSRRSVFVPLFFRSFVLSVLVPLFLCSFTLASPHTLTVTLRDVDGAGIAGATITVRDEAGTHDLAHTTTDAQGSATLPNLTADVVRVAVSGTLADGTPLNQRGQDAHGIWLLLDAPLVQLDLRSERNGAIIPDPTTMISPDAPIPATPPATLEVATFAPTPAATTRVPTSAAIVPTVAVGVPTAIPFAALPPAAAPPDAPTIRPSVIGQGMVIVGTLILLLLVGWFIIQRRATR
jgi:hypothetical protein